MTPWCEPLRATGGANFAAKHLPPFQKEREPPAFRRAIVTAVTGQSGDRNSLRFRAHGSTLAAIKSRFRTPGGCMTQPKPVRQQTSPNRLTEIAARLRMQRLRIDALANKTWTLRTRGKHLLAESKSLADTCARSFTQLAGIYLTMKTAESEFRRHGGDGRSAHPPKSASRPPTERSPDLVDVLAQATEILETEFFDTEGSGRETLARCEMVLQRTRRKLTMDLPLY